MLFNSFEFLLFYFPFVAIGFFLLGKTKKLNVGLSWLILSSLVFHAYFKASYTWLLVSSISVNYLIGDLCRPDSSFTPSYRKLISVVGILFNVLLLFYFKYSNFLAQNFWMITGIKIDIGTNVLPLAISFYTFQQIAYLVDAYRGVTKKYSFFQYFSYLSFFPHLIAGPIVRHDDLISQMSNPKILRVKSINVIVGINIILIGLFKKVILADGLAEYVDPLFSAVSQGSSLTFFEAWFAAIFFSFVVYFDFSGYSDIAIGLARVFNIYFPVNFASPYKASNIIDFWRRWHITLSNFLREYLYIPLGGNRKSEFRRHLNLLITMLVGGLWHGANWNFVIWGGIHGLYLIINHLWRKWKIYVRCPFTPNNWLSCIITYLAVTIAWVFFRATSFTDAVNILKGMFGFNGVTFPVLTLEYARPLLKVLNLQESNFIGLFPNIILPQVDSGFWMPPTLKPVLMLIGVFYVIWFLPNTQQFMKRYKPDLSYKSGFELQKNEIILDFCWRPSWLYIGFFALMAVYIMTKLENVNTFVYFRF